jgi:hypothetical protein
MAMTQSEIVSQINRFALHSMDIGPAPDVKALADLSLQDMLDAVRQIERDNAAAREKGIATNTAFDTQIVPDDRLTAAVYTWLHYCAPDYHDAGDDDDAIVHLKIGRTRHGLIKWARTEK